MIANGDSQGSFSQDAAQAGERVVSGAKKAKRAYDTIKKGSAAAKGAAATKSTGVLSKLIANPLVLKIATICVLIILLALIIEMLPAIVFNDSMHTVDSEIVNNYIGEDGDSLDEALDSLMYGEEKEENVESMTTQLESFEAGLQEVFQSAIDDALEDLQDEAGLFVVLDPPDFQPDPSLDAQSYGGFFSAAYSATKKNYMEGNIYTIVPGFESEERGTILYTEMGGGFFEEDTYGKKEAIKALEKQIKVPNPDWPCGNMIYGARITERYSVKIAPGIYEQHAKCEIFEQHLEGIPVRDLTNSPIIGDSFDETYLAPFRLAEAAFDFDRKSPFEPIESIEDGETVYRVGNKRLESLDDWDPTTSNDYALSYGGVIFDQESYLLHILAEYIEEEDADTGLVQRIIQVIPEDMSADNVWTDSGSGTAVGGRVVIDLTTIPGYENIKNHDVIQAALKEYESLGGKYYRGGKYGPHPGAWCADFVSWVAKSMGYNERDFPQSPSCGSMIQVYKEEGRYHKPGRYIPKPGDVVFFDWEPDGGQDHVGIVLAVEDGGNKLITIEGNTTGPGVSQGLFVKTRYRKNVFGYGCPNYRPEHLEGFVYP